MIPAAVVAALFVLLTSVRLADWRDDFALFGAEVRLSPRSKLAPLHLGAAYLDAGDPAAALELFELSLSIDPGFDLAQRNAARAREQLRSLP